MLRTGVKNRIVFTSQQKYKLLTLTKLYFEKLQSKAIKNIYLSNSRSKEGFFYRVFEKFIF